ncbi:hypothetical protein GCM10020218_099550 [Dactylosporangium vinaceum]|uniref:Acyltransferase n=1 Tax=Dactylosporangium vinaceum TaxID=53362 RepID=A0ABV5MAN0_9ACTN|nr:hypothetical protein [Dactylosporangium vinaceum]
MRRNAVALFFLAPLVAEFLLGDFGLNALFALLFLAPMYGGGAILIREVARRTGRGWPAMLTLALAYGVIEEGLVTQSLFNPDYAGLHLLRHWFIPGLGISVPWTITVLAVHTVWSIAVPIALVENLSPATRTTPWLRGPGLVVAAALAVAGAAMNIFGTRSTDHFTAPWPRLAGAALVAVALIGLAFRWRHPAPAAGPVPSPWWLLVLTLAAGALFRLPAAVPTWAAVGLMAVAFGGMTAVVLRLSRRDGWGDAHRLALAAGATLTYAWHSFFMTPFQGDGPVITPVSHAVFAALALLLLYCELRALRRAARRAHVPSSARQEPGERDPADLLERPVTGQPGVQQRQTEEDGPALRPGRRGGRDATVGGPDVGV